MSLEDDRYSVVNGSIILQGDFVARCPNLLIPANYLDNLDQEVPVIFYNVVVLTQSCDLVNENCDNILVAPIEEKSTFHENNPEVNIPQLLKKQIFRFYPLRPCTIEGFKSEEFIVDFTKIFSVPYVFLKAHVESLGDRLRVKSPYREGLSQAYGISIMRVAEP